MPACADMSLACKPWPDPEPVDRLSATDRFRTEQGQSRAEAGGMTRILVIPPGRRFGLTKRVRHPAGMQKGRTTVPSAKLLAWCSACILLDSWWLRRWCSARNLAAAPQVAASLPMHARMTPRCDGQPLVRTGAVHYCCCSCFHALIIACVTEK